MITWAVTRTPSKVTASTHTALPPLRRETQGAGELAAARLRMLYSFEAELFTIYILDSS